MIMCRSLMLLFIMIFLQSCTRTEYSGSNVLRADIAFTNQHLIINNMDVIVWNNVVITLDRNYTYRMDVLPRGKSSIPYNAFADSSHHNYEPGLLKARSVVIAVKQGSDSAEGHFKW